MSPRATGPGPEPIKTDTVDIDNVEIRYRNQLDSGILMEDPARGSFTALAARRIGKLSMEIGLGTEHPDKMLVTTDRKNIYFAPVLDHPQANDVSWQGNRGSLNLIKTFTVLHRLLEPGTNEFYRIEADVVTIEHDGQQFQALRAPLKKVPLNRIGGLTKKSTSTKKTAKPTTTETKA